MATFFQSTYDIPVPDVLENEFVRYYPERTSTLDDYQLEVEKTFASVYEFITKNIKHSEMLSRGLNATAQMAWGKELGTSYSTSPTEIASITPQVLTRTNIIFPTFGYVQVHYKAVCEIDTAPGATEELYASVLVGSEFKAASETTVNLASSWEAGQVVTLSGHYQFNLDKATNTTLGLGVGIRNQSTGVVTVRDVVSGFDYRIEPRVAGA